MVKMVKGYNGDRGSILKKKKWSNLFERNNNHLWKPDFTFSKPFRLIQPFLTILTIFYHSDQLTIFAIFTTLQVFSIVTDSLE